MNHKNPSTDKKYTYLLVVPHALTINQNHEFSKPHVKPHYLLPKQLLIFKFLPHMFVYPKRIPLYLLDYLHWH